MSAGLRFRTRVPIAGYDSELSTSEFTDRSGEPKSRSFASSPYSAAWSTTSPVSSLHPNLNAWHRWMLRLKLEAPHGDQEEDDGHCQQDTDLWQNLGEGRVFRHQAVVPLDGVGVRRELC